MRMWMVPPRMMCRPHLLGEYREIFAFVGTLKLKKSVEGYIRNNLLEPLSLESRYIELRDECTRRGYLPKASLVFDSSVIAYLPEEYRNYRIDRIRSLRDLTSRCPLCRKGEIDMMRII